MNTNMTKKMIAQTAADLFNAEIATNQNKDAMLQALEAEGRTLAETLREEALEAGCNREAVSMLFQQMDSDPLSEDGLAAQESLEDLIEARTSPVLEEIDTEQDEVAEEETVENLLAFPTVKDEEHEVVEGAEDLQAALEEILAESKSKALIDRVINDWINSHKLPDPPLSAADLDKAQFALWKESKTLEKEGKADEAAAKSEEAVNLILNNNERGKEREELVKALREKADQVWEIVSEPYKEELEELYGEVRHLDEQISELEKALNLRPSQKQMPAVRKAASTGHRTAIIVDGMSNRQFNIHALKEGIYTRDEIVTMAHDKGYGTEKECRKRLTGLLGQLRAKGQLEEGEDHLKMIG